MPIFVYRKMELVLSLSQFSVHRSSKREKVVRELWLWFKRRKEVHIQKMRKENDEMKFTDYLYHPETVSRTNRVYWK